MALRAVLGGTFDPVHAGHLHAAHAVARELGVAPVTLMLSARPPHRAAIASVEDRWRMLCLAVGREPGLEASDMELRRDGPSFAIDTIRALAARGDTVVWILGSDGLDAFSAWHAHEAFAESCHIAVLARPEAAVKLLPGFREVSRGAELARREAGFLYVAKTPMRDVSATEVRGLIARGQDASGLLTPTVWNYIRKRGLYRG